MVQESGQAQDCRSSGHRHRLPNLHKKFVANAQIPDHTDAIKQTSDTNWFRLIILLSILLALLTGVIFLIAKYTGDEIARAGHTIVTDTRRISINSDVITAPANIIRYASQRKLVEARQLDLYLHWPRLQGYSEELKDVFNDTQNKRDIIFVTLAPRFSTFDMSARIDPIYRKFFTTPALEIGNGLISHELDPNAGFIDEYLIVEKNNPYPYSARCIKTTTTVATPYCIRDIQIGKGLSLTYRFHVSLIPHWLTLERSIRQKFKAMIS